MNAGKFRKVIKTFELKESIEEVIDIQKDKAHMAGIKLSAVFKPQEDEGNLVSLFNKRPNVSPQRNGRRRDGLDPNQESESSDDNQDGPQYELAKIASGPKTEPPVNIMVESDKRRFQQVILNIQSNALKFSEQGGKVQVFYSVYNQKGRTYCEV